MKNFTLIHETPDHFVLHNGVAHFHVAKKGIDQPTADKIRSFAKGGEVEHDKKNIEQLDNSMHKFLKEEESEKMAEGGKLDANARKHIASKNFAGPDRSYPIEDVSHARNSLARVSQHGSPELKAQVREKVHAKYPGIEQSKDEGGTVKPTDSGAQSFQDSFRKATGQPVSGTQSKAQGGEMAHYDQGGTAGDDSSGEESTLQKLGNVFTSAFEPAKPTPTPAPDHEAEYAKIRAKNGENFGRSPASYAAGGDISKETQSQAIKRYADGNPATLSKGGHVHHNAGKNQIHLHFYDGAPVTIPLDTEENEGPLKKRVNLADPSGDVGQEAASQGVPTEINLSAKDIDPSAIINIPKASMPQAQSGPTPESTANDLAELTGTKSSSEPAAPNSIPATVPPNQQVKIAQTPPPQPGTDLISQLSNADKLEKSALKDGAESQAEYFDKQKKILTDQMVDQQNRYDAYNQAQTENQNHLDQLFKNVSDGKLDPNRYWNQLGAGGKIAASIGILLSGIGTGLAPNQQNLAIQSLNQHIANDIEAQKNDQSQNMNLYKLGLEKYHDAQAAYNFATLNANAMAAGLLQKAAATAGSAQAAQAAQMGIAQLTKQSIPLQQSLNMHQVAMQMAGGNNGTANINQEALPDEMRDRAVRLPNGNLGLSPTKEDAALSRKSFTSLDSLDKNLDTFLSTMKEIGPTLNPWGADAAKSEAAKANIVLELNQLHGLNRMNDNEYNSYLQNVPTAGTWRPNRALAQIMYLKKMVADKRQAEMANNIEGYKQPKLTPGPAK